MSGELETTLMKLGFSLYEAKVYSALLSLCNSTMREISEKSGVPYQKVYDVIKSLENKGLVRIIEGRPKKVKIIDPSFALKIYRDKIVNEMDNYIKIIISFWNERRENETERSLHVKGIKTIIRLIKDLANKSNKIDIVYDNLPDWLIKILKNFNGNLTVVTSSNNLNLHGKIKIDNVKSRFIIFDDSLLVTFNGNDEIIIDSCKGCVIQAKEHFELLTYKSE
ncbi:TrmB family transcriptional regulator [Sulfurisphaera ohwakuensis]|uniref:Sugar-specific transcriptional regulator TrmB n=1 Tax=Sulfurisphaera ohwakuensis TaxID=69656 RepID=A0A650CI46_SULOH|nr:TrmB family transcriptional regulator [Sulfurisphaera ohwakuensis]MBB5254700.1 sugar-specific transcriptional regulator TrmB [Sulfurisphaera ohwakuensis]QGR17345.1 TrmB family transcriptional regulator [Sulfurisphaera ohwakuensis]